MRRHVGLNMGTKQAYVRYILSVILALIAWRYEQWYLLILALILFYTASTRFCLMFSLLGINKKLSIENYFHALIPKYSPQASAIFDENGSVIYSNKAAEETFTGLRDARFFSIDDVTPFIDQNRINDTLFEYKGQTFQLHLHGIKKEHILLLQANNITDVLQLEYLNANLQDEVANALSQNEIKNHLLAQQSKMATTGAMVENIVHQWRQPLSTLSALIQLIQLRNSMSDTQDTQLDDEMQQAQKLINIMNNTVDDFRNFFKIDKARSYFTLQSCIEDVMLVLGSSLQKTGITVVNRVDPAIRVYGYKNEITQVLLNIVNNAKDAFEEHPVSKPSIELNSTMDDTRVRLKIGDNAGGIPEEYLPKIFDSHFTTKTHTKGTGIGLHMSKIIIEEDMKGTLEAENAQNGASFTITLPREPELQP